MPRNTRQFFRSVVFILSIFIFSSFFAKDVKAEASRVKLKEESIDNWEINAYKYINGENTHIENANYTGESFPIVITVAGGETMALYEEGVDYSLEVTGSNVRKELIKDSYTELRNMYLNYGYNNYNIARTYVPSSSLINWHNLLYRLGIYVTDGATQHDLVHDFDFIASNFSSISLEELRKYSSAREYIRNLDFSRINNDEITYDDNLVVREHSDEDNIERIMRNYGSTSIDDHMNKLVSKNQAKRWFVQDIPIYEIVIYVDNSNTKVTNAVTKAKEKGYAVTTVGSKVRIHPYTERKKAFDKNQYYFYYIDTIANELGLASTDYTKAKELKNMNGYYLEYSFTNRQFIDAWAEEMDTWKGHWDHLLYGDQNFKYWIESSEPAEPGYGLHNWGNGFHVVMDQVQITHPQKYKYNIVGPGQVTVAIKGTNNTNGLQPFVGEKTATFYVQDEYSTKLESLTNQKNAYIKSSVYVRSATTNKIVDTYNRGKYLYGQLREDGFVYFNYNGFLAKVHGSFVIFANPETYIINEDCNIRDQSNKVVGRKSIGTQIKGVRIGNYYRFYEDGEKFVYYTMVDKKVPLNINGRNAYIRAAVYVRNPKGNMIMTTLSKGKYIYGELRSDGFVYFDYKGLLAKVHSSFVVFADPQTYVITENCNVRDSNNKIVGRKLSGSEIKAVKIGVHYRFFEKGEKFVYYSFVKLKSTR